MINVLEMLESSCKLYPQSIALKDEVTEFTYQDYLKSAKKIATGINEILTAKKQPIAVFIDRTPYPLIMFMAVVYSGNFYVPIDSTQPTNRLKNMLDTVEPVLILSHNSNDEDLANKISNSSVPFATFKELIDNQIDETALKTIRSKATDYDPVYCIFTSGSTGTPKGIVVSHRSIIDLVHQFETAFELNKDSIFANQAPYDFDVSVKDIYGAMLVGATIVITPKQLFSSPIKLIEFLNEHHIDTLIWATSAIRIIANFDTFSALVPKHLKLVMFSGEIMPNKVLNYWRKFLPEVKFVNLFGPTEITCNCSYYIVERDFSDEDPLPIGIPFVNTEIILLDDNNELISQPNQIGELCVLGTSLALGYYNQEDETQVAFVQNPLNDRYIELMYRTGDLAHYNDLGELMFVSRKDDQIKHMGHRIELAEIERIANAYKDINAAFCFYSEKQEKIFLFYSANTEKKREIYRFMRDRLPKYMLPNVYVHKEKLPVNKNNKIDRKRVVSEFFQ